MHAFWGYREVFDTPTQLPNQVFLDDFVIFELYRQEKGSIFIHFKENVIMVNKKVRVVKVIDFYEDLLETCKPAIRSHKIF